MVNQENQGADKNQENQVNQGADKNQENQGTHKNQGTRKNHGANLLLCTLLNCKLFAPKFMSKPIFIL